MEPNQNYSNSGMGGGAPNQMPIPTEKKSGSLVWSIITVLVIAGIIYALIKMFGGSTGDNSYNTPADQNTPTDSTTFGPESNSDNVSDIEADLNSTNYSDLNSDLGS